MIVKRWLNLFYIQYFNVCLVVICYVRNMVKKSLSVYLFKVFSDLVQLYMVSRVFYSLLKVYSEAHLFIATF